MNTMSSIFSLKGVKETKVHIPLRHTYLYDLSLDFLGLKLTSDRRFFIFNILM